MKYQPGPALSYVNEGQKVFAPATYEGKPMRVLCEVLTACGNTAQVENSRYHFCRWFAVCDLYAAIPITDPEPDGGEPLPEPARRTA